MSNLPKLMAWEDFKQQPQTIDLLARFKNELDGNVLFLDFAWKKFPKWPWDRKNKLSKASKTISGHARKLRAALEVSKDGVVMERARKTLLLELLAEIIHNIELQSPYTTTPGSPKTKVLNYYWCMALVPYLEGKVSKVEMWDWIAAWLQQINEISFRSTTSIYPDSLSRCDLPPEKTAS